MGLLFFFYGKPFQQSFFKWEYIAYSLNQPESSVHFSLFSKPIKF